MIRLNSSHFLPEICHTWQFAQEGGSHQYDVFTHTVKAVSLTPPTLVLRLAALYFVFRFFSADWKPRRTWQNVFALIFECAVVLVSRFTDGYLFGLLASVIGVVGVNWIFTYPYMQLNFTISGYPLTFLVMLAVSVVVGTLTTQIKQQEKLRAEAEKEKMRGNLLRAVSHDIRTPLTAIVGGIDAILENGDQISPETRKSLLENMRDESNWLIGVVENLLSVTRMSGASNIKKELEAGEEVLGAASMKFKRHYPAVEVSITAPDTLLMIPMDIILVEQVLINLMENAVQHGKTTTKIELRLSSTGGFAVFEVADNGCGIEKELLPHLFEGYLTRDHEEISDQRRNMGIGLSVCMSIVQAHGGTMRAKNRKKGGALLQFTLPLEEISHEYQREGSSN